MGDSLLLYPQSNCYLFYLSTRDTFHDLFFILFCRSMHLEKKNIFQCLFKLSVVLFNLIKAFLHYKQRCYCSFSKCVHGTLD